MIRIPTLIFASTMIVFASFAAKAAELHEFVAGTPILAEEINDNFRLLQSADGIRVNCDSGDSLVARAFPSTPGLCGWSSLDPVPRAPSLLTAKI